MENQTVRHVLIFKTSPKITPEVFGQFLQSFRGLCQKIEGILSFEYGANNSPEGLNQGMTHVVSLTFVNSEARDAYLRAGNRTKRDLSRVDAWLTHRTTR